MRSHRHSSAAAWAAVAAFVLASPVALTDARGQPQPPPRIAAARDTLRDQFWTALSTLDFATAGRRAPDAEHRAFVDAMIRVVDGQLDEAEAPLHTLAVMATDSMLRRAAAIMLASALHYQAKWEAVLDLAHETSASVADEGGRASLMSWATAMRNTPPSSIAFPAKDSLVTLRLSAFGTPMVEVTIAGKRKLFWIDTGSTISLVASDVAAECGLVPLVADSLEIVTTVGRVAALPTVIPRISLGKVVVMQQPAAIVSRQALSITQQRERHSTAVIEIDGVIGLDLLRRLDVRLNFDEGYVDFRRPPTRAPSSTRPRNLFWLGFPVVRLTGPNGGPMYFGLDTGADSTYGTDELLAKLPRLGYRKRELRIKGIGGDTTVALPNLPELRVKIDAHAFRFRDLIIRDSHRLIFFELDGVLGSDTGRHTQMRIDLTNGIFAIGPAPG